MSEPSPNPENNGHQRIIRAPLLPFVLDRRGGLDAIPDRERPSKIPVEGQEEPPVPWHRVGVKVIPYLFSIIIGIVMKNPQKVVTAIVGAIAVIVLEAWNFEIPEFLLRALESGIVGLVMWLQTSPFDRKK